MTEPKPYDISKLFTGLVGRDVSFAHTLHPAETKAKKVYGIYSEVLTNKAIVVKADLPLLGHLGGAFLGLPSDTSLERATQTPMDEYMRDAIHELLNVGASALSTESRVVFKTFVMDPVLCDGDATDVVQKPDMKSAFNVSLDGQAQGTFIILSRF